MHSDGNGGTCDVAVVGGGLGGLACAGLLGRAGLDVVVLERAATLGGRASTHERAGFCFNEGAHAFYRGGAAARVLGRLGVRPVGKSPPAAGVAVLDGRTHALPTTLGSLFTTGLVGWGAKLQGARLFSRLATIDTSDLADVSWREWAEAQVPDPTMRATLEAFVRVSTYVDAPAAVSAAATLAQLRLAQTPGVLYVDGGWRTIVEATTASAREAGCQVRTGARVSCARRDHSGGGWTVTMDAGEPLRCRALVLATGPMAARSIVASEILADWAERCVPVRAACLDVALSQLPDPRTTFALGVDRPLYLSVHSRTARVAPAGAALVSTMKYLRPGTKSDPAEDLAELEAWLDRLQPGWRELSLDRRWLPSMVATHALVAARDGGFAGRPGPAIPDAPGAWVVGDWVGREGMLLDASLASGAEAADEIAARLGVAKVA